MTADAGRRVPTWEDTASRPGAASRRHKVFVIRLISFLTNYFISNIPSWKLRHVWYRRVLGIELGPRAGVHLGCYWWFYGPGQVRRTGVSIGANSRINRDCTIDVRGGVTIGDNVSISPQVAISTAAHSAADLHILTSALRVTHEPRKLSGHASRITGHGTRNTEHFP